MKRLLIATLVASLLPFSFIGCSKVEDTHSVEWYRAPENRVAFEAKLAECKSNPGELKDTPNCINAFQAFELNFIHGPISKR